MKKTVNAVKNGAGVATSIGVGIIVGNLIKCTTPIDISKIAKTFVNIGALVITGAVGDLASKYTDKQIDDVIILAKGFINDEVDEENN